MYCKKCGRMVKDNVTYCPYCGADLSEMIEDDQMEIPDEANEFVDNDVRDQSQDIAPVMSHDNYEHEQYQSVEEPKQPMAAAAGPAVNEAGPVQTEEQISPKSKVVTLCLCFFFGVLGIHRFYAGKPVSGIIYLLTCGIAGIGDIVDFFVILFDGFKDGDGLPIKK